MLNAGELLGAGLVLVGLWALVNVWTAKPKWPTQACRAKGCKRVKVLGHRFCRLHGGHPGDGSFRNL